VKLRLARASSSQVRHTILESSRREMKILLILLNLISLTAVLHISGLLPSKRRNRNLRAT
jgi:type IV secretory pathway component VirB8